jgi:hypothetical protein
MIVRTHRMADGSFQAAEKADGAWRLCWGSRVPTRTMPARSSTGGASSVKAVAAENVADVEQHDPQASA